MLVALLLIVPAAFAETPSGLWDAVVDFNGTDVHFRLEISVDGSKAAGAFINGGEKAPATSGKFDNGALTLKFDEHAAELNAALNEGTLEGLWGPFKRKYYSFQAKRHENQAVETAEVPDIAGLWEIGVRKSGEAAWNLIVRQDGAEVSATILRVDGDTGEIAGRYADGKFLLSHFSGARVASLTLTPGNDGTLGVRLFDDSGAARHTAVRPEEARAKGQQPPADPYEYTKVKNPDEPLYFSFPDLNGRVISNEDKRFRGKVVLVNVSASWSPSAHDQAAFLSELYGKYRNRGLEIVSISFEETSQLKDPARLRAFIKKYNIEYPVLIGGEPEERDAKLTQPVNLTSWPTTFFIGRDGAVKFVRAGFPGTASGELYNQARSRMENQVEQLLSEGETLARK
jgi:peroxiredoxin